MRLSEQFAGVLRHLHLIYRNRVRVPGATIGLARNQPQRYVILQTGHCDLLPDFVDTQLRNNLVIAGGYFAKMKCAGRVGERTGYNLPGGAAHYLDSGVFHWGSVDLLHGSTERRGAGAGHEFWSGWSGAHGRANAAKINLAEERTCQQKR